MAIFTNAELAEQKAQWKAALLACTTGQEYSIGTRRLRRSDLPEIRATLDWLDGQTTSETETAGQGGPRIAPLIPRRPR